jgi:hypothetical protein
MMMIISLIMVAYAGAFTGNDSMYNVSITFGALYIADKIGEFTFRRGGFSVFIFLTCVAMYFASLWLNTHPDFLASVLIQQGKY